MAVRTDQRLAGFGKALQMHLVADAVAGAGIPHADLFGDRADEAVVVGVHKAALERVVVDVSDGQFRLDAGNPHGLILEICHRAGGVLRQGLVNAQTRCV